MKKHTPIYILMLSLVSLIIILSIWMITASSQNVISPEKSNDIKSPAITSSETAKSALLLQDDLDNSSENANSVEIKSKPSSNAKNQNAITQNIMYSFEDTNLILLKSVDASIGKAMDFDRMNDDGVLDSGYSVVLTTMTVKNILDKQQTVMLNNVTITFLIDDKPASGAISMRYFDKGDLSSRAYFKQILQANEELVCTVGFLVDDSWLEYGEPIFSINPGGTYPPNEDARIIPISLNFSDE